MAQAFWLAGAGAALKAGQALRWHELNANPAKTTARIISFFISLAFISK
jgi:hypothetical protein